MNRGIARRTLFELEVDMRFFQSQLARSVRRGEVEIHAFCLLSTHYHALVRCPRDGLGRAFQEIQTKYSRYFNRGRKRDGSLVRGRFRSKLVDSLEYRQAVVSYIDANAVKAGTCDHPFEYRFGSAWHYARTKGPPWLTRNWIEEEVRQCAHADRYDPKDYGRAFPVGNEDVNDLVELRLRSSARTDDLADLVRAAPLSVRSWFIRKARLADGTKPVLPVATPRIVEIVMRARQEEAWLVQPTARTRDGWPLARVGLERDLCSSTFAELGHRVGTSEVTAFKRYQLHRRLLLEDRAYAARCGQLGAEVMARVSNGVRRRT